MIRHTISACSWAVMFSLAFVLFTALWVFPANITPQTAKIMAIWTACALVWGWVLESIEKRGEK